MENISKIMSDKLKGLRAENNFSQEKIAEKLDVHRETFRKYENDPVHIDVGVFLEILQLYNTSPIIFFEQIYGKMPFDNQKQE